MPLFRPNTLSFRRKRRLTAFLGFFKTAWERGLSLMLIGVVTLGLALGGVQLGLAQRSPAPFAQVAASLTPHAQEDPSHTGQTPVAETITATPETWLQRGDRNPSISQLKQQLQQLGYDPGDRTHQFNRATQQQVLQFQQDTGIGIDGIVGPQTQAALAQALTQAIAHAGQSPRQSATTAEGLPAAAAVRAATAPDIARILERGQLIVAVLSRNNSPFFMTDTGGELIGSDVAMAQQLAQQLGVELVFKRTAKTFNEVVDQVYHLEADLAISKISRTLQRAQQVSFSQPYLNMRQGLLVNRVQFARQSKGENIAETLRNLEGKVGVIKGSAYVGFVQQKFPKATVAEFPTWAQVVEAVTRGEVLAAYRDELEVKKIVRTNPDSSLQFQTVALTDTQDPLAVVLPWDSRQLKAFVDYFLESFHPDYTVDTLLDRYVDQL